MIDINFNFDEFFSTPFERLSLAAIQTASRSFFNFEGWLTANKGYVDDMLSHVQVCSIGNNSYFLAEALDNFLENYKSLNDTSSKSMVENEWQLLSQEYKELIELLFKFSKN